jgi:hypothetical protein
MTVTFKLNNQEIHLDVEDICILYAYVDTLQNKYPKYNFTNCRFIKGNKYIKLSDVVRDGDVITIIS